MMTECGAAPSLHNKSQPLHQPELGGGELEEGGSEGGDRKRDGQEGVGIGVFS